MDCLQETLGKLSQIWSLKAWNIHWHWEMFSLGGVGLQLVELCPHHHWSRSTSGIRRWLGPKFKSWKSQETRMFSWRFLSDASLRSVRGAGRSPGLIGNPYPASSGLDWVTRLSLQAASAARLPEGTDSGSASPALGQPQPLFPRF